MNKVHNKERINSTDTYFDAIHQNKVEIFFVCIFDLPSLSDLINFILFADVTTVAIKDNTLQPYHLSVVFD